MLPVIPVILGLLAFGGLLVVTRKKAPAVPGVPPELPPVVVVPFDVEELVEEIEQASSLSELNAYYYLISERFVNMEYSHVEYMALYAAYAARWNQLVGGSE